MKMSSSKRIFDSCFNVWKSKIANLYWVVNFAFIFFFIGSADVAHAQQAKNTSGSDFSEAVPWANSSPFDRRCAIWVTSREKTSWLSIATQREKLRERQLAAELARLNVDVIVATGPTVTRALKEATSTIPIVMAQDGNPVASGLVASLARPGGNITGLSNLSPELSGKRLELLKEIVPKLALVTVIGSSNEPDTPQILKEMELAAGTLKVKLHT
jgi:hypothetical protein